MDQLDFASLSILIKGRFNGCITLNHLVYAVWSFVFLNLAHGFLQWDLSIFLPCLVVSAAGGNNFCPRELNILLNQSSILSLWFVLGLRTRNMVLLGEGKEIKV